MSRERYYSENQISRMHMERNTIFQQYQTVFRQMFGDFNGVARLSHQKKWYVGKRWNSVARCLTNQDDKPEKDMLDFINDNDVGSRRNLRLLYGSPGVGKTTFLNHFFNNYLPKEIQRTGQNVLCIIIDCPETCIDVASLEKDVDLRTHELLRNLAPWLEDEPHCMRMWEEEYDFDKPFTIALWSKLSPAETTAEKLKLIAPERNNYQTFNRVRINYLIKLGYKVILVWDNLDQTPEEMQHAAIRLAVHKRAWCPGIKVIISVRATTLPLAMAAMAAAAYRLSDQELFPPDVHSVLARRADTAIKTIKTASVSINVAPSANVVIGSPANFFKQVLKSLESRDIEEPLCALSVDNVRMQLKMMEQVLQSPHIPTPLIAEMVRTYYPNSHDSHNEIRLSWRNFMESLICSEYKYHRKYGNAASMVLNLFESDIPMPAFCNSLCMPRILQMINRHREANVGEVVKMLGILGYPKIEVRKCLVELLSTVLVESPQGMLTHIKNDNKSIPEYYRVRCTSAGIYYIKSLIKELVYVQNMSIVTSLEYQFRQNIQPWVDQSSLAAMLEANVYSAAALIAQIHKDEESEMAAIQKSVEGKKIYDDYGFGTLAFTLVKGCNRSLDNIGRTLAKQQRAETVDWSQLKSIINAASGNRFGLSGFE
ncbi:MAG: hypothetical protein NT018_07945 [Armatimonadetes bacterium]|nr:hypothetical protein [Armatimonadota bacterium]